MNQLMIGTIGTIRKNPTHRNRVYCKGYVVIAALNLCRHLCHYICTVCRVEARFMVRYLPTCMTCQNTGKQECTKRRVSIYARWTPCLRGITVRCKHSVNVCGCTNVSQCSPDIVPPAQKRILIYAVKRKTHTRHLQANWLPGNAHEK